MDQEQEEFQAALLRSVEDMKAGKFARKTVFVVDGEEVRRVSQAPQVQRLGIPGSTS